MMKFWLGACLALCASWVWAGDAAELGAIEFSDDGRYVAIEQYGIRDGSGEVYVKWLFIDVPSNRYAAKPIETVLESKEDNDEENTLAHIRQQAHDKTKPQREKFEINAKKTYFPVISRPLNDVGADPSIARFAVGTPLAGLAYRTYAVRLTKKAAEAECYGMGSAKMFTLSLENEGSKKKVTLQTDKKVPASRGCPLDYRIAYIYVEGTDPQYITVLLNVFTPGFEGQDMRYLVVTGELR